MAKSRISFGPFRRLQWRLTLSYTLVTVAALVIVELAVVGLLLLILNSDFLAQEIVGALKDDLAPRASLYLESTPPDVEGLNRWLQLVVDDSVAVSQEGRRITQGFSVKFDQNYQVFVIDNEGMLLAQVSQGHDPDALGSQFDSSSIPGLAAILMAAQAGVEAIDQLYVTTPEGSLVMALPIKNLSGDILGTLIATMLIPAFNLQTLGSIAILLLISVIVFTLAAGVIGAIFGFLTSRGLTRRIESLSSAAEAWSQGDFSIISTDKSADELGQLSQRLNSMAEQLQNLMQTYQELAAVEERNRLARELHDSVKQQVFATTMQVGAAQALLPGDPDKALEHLNEAENLSRQSQEELAILIQELRPTTLGKGGLVEALESYAADWSRQSTINARVQTRGEITLPIAVEQTLFRVAQESLSNVARHSGAAKVDILLTSEPDVVTLSISDDGQGFDLSEARDEGFGIRSMQERIENLDGTVTVETKPGRGTRVLVSVPVTREEI